MRILIRAERTGNWNLHVECVAKMLPYFLSAGHLNYAKSAQLYYQEMTNLKASLSEAEYNLFVLKGFFSVRRSKKLWAGLWTDLTIEQVLMRSMKSQGGLTRGRGLSVKTIARWISAMPMSTRISEAIELFSGVRTGTSEQHVEMRDSRQKRDCTDYKKFLQRLTQNDPFQGKPVDELVSLSTGIKADGTVHCDNAKSHGVQILEKTAANNGTFGGLSLHRKDRLSSLASMSKSIRVAGHKVTVNVTQLFHRIVLMSKGDDDLKVYMQYELAPLPMSLFDDVSFRKGTKSSLVSALEALAPPSSEVPTNPDYVIDGGWLLHKVVWPKVAPFKHIVAAYVNYVVTNYSDKCSVVFDGYPEEPSTKDEEHKRRALKPTSANINVDSNTASTVGQSSFLNNNANKAQLISMISHDLRARGINVVQAHSDADRLIVTTAIHRASEDRNVVVVANDTDILVLLASLTPLEAKTYMLARGTGSTSDRVFNCRELRLALGDDALFLLFVHAMTGCDTCSAVYRKGKRSTFRQTRTSKTLLNICKVFLNSLSTHDEIASAGEQFFLHLFGVPRVCSTLGAARFTLYKRTVAKQGLTARFDLSTLPPTFDAARHQSFRVFHQVQSWLGNDLNPLQWGWILNGGRMEPLKMSEKPAPDELLSLIMCNCKDDCEKDCTCRSAGMKCSGMCGHCSGTACLNKAVEMDTDDEEEPDEPAAEVDSEGDEA